MIRNGIDAARWPFAPARPRTGPAELLYVGRLEYEKGVHDAIAALPRIRRTHPGTTLTIAGRGHPAGLAASSRPASTGCSRQLGFVGHLDHDELLAAAASGRCRGAAQPLRAVRHRRAGGRRGRHSAGDVEHRRSGRGGDRRPDRGVVSRPRDVAGLASAVRAVLDDPDAAQRRARAARERLTSDFDWDRGRARPLRCIWPPSAASASRSHGCPSSSTPCRTANLQYVVASGILFERGRRADRRRLCLARQTGCVQPTLAAVAADAVGHRGRLAQGRAGRRSRYPAGCAGSPCTSPTATIRRGVSSTPSAATGWPRCRHGLAVRWRHTHDFEDLGTAAPGSSTGSTHRYPGPRCDPCSPTGTGSWPTI